MLPAFVVVFFRVRWRRFQVNLELVKAFNLERTTSNAVTNVSSDPCSNSTCEIRGAETFQKLFDVEYMTRKVCKERRVNIVGAHPAMVRMFSQ